MPLGAASYRRRRLGIGVRLGVNPGRLLREASEFYLGPTSRPNIVSVRETGVLVVAIYLTAVLACIVLAMVTQLRFYRAYIDRYGDRRRRWQFWLLPDGSSFLWGRFWYRLLDDPQVERRRRQALLAWIPAFVLVCIPILWRVFEDSGAIEGALVVVFFLSSVIGGIYWWTSISSEREQLPRWGVWVYIASGVVGLAAFALLIAVHFRLF
jgi:hypothetical protein